MHTYCGIDMSNTSRRTPVTEKLIEHSNIRVGQHYDQWSNAANSGDQEAFPGRALQVFSSPSALGPSLAPVFGTEGHPPLPPATAMPPKTRASEGPDTEVLLKYQGVAPFFYLRFP
ncbi:hypothetical protein UY3_03110 [Chelonia mydas]|uniref:Uncharacterized protein n=1 Tax=Chelonia mydas TaxID=8469 RepID=M7BP06_CHEMY|nr:hypothetical protein UY3_03110 [Chelonia mydas]